MKIANWYNNNTYKYAKGTSASFVAEKELNLFAKKIFKKGIILDVGSGLGQDTEYLSKKGYNVIGIDVSREMIKYSLDNRKSGIFINIDFFKIRDIFNGHYFDGLWASSTILTHIAKKDAGKFFNEARLLLSAKGILGIIVRKDAFKKREILFNNFSKEEISSLVIKNGFKIIEARELSVENHDWIFMLSEVAHD